MRKIEISIKITFDKDFFGVDYSAMDRLGVPSELQKEILEKANRVVCCSLLEKKVTACHLRELLVKKMPSLCNRIQIEDHYDLVLPCLPPLFLSSEDPGYDSEFDSDKSIF